MQKSRTIEVNLPADKLWQAMGERFGDNGLWAASLTSSHLTGKLEVGVNRVCMNKTQETVEELTMFSPEKLELAYRITSDLPAIIKNASNHWSIKPIGTDKCLVTSHVKSDLVWWAMPLNPLMSLAIGGILAKAMDEFKHWAETGEQHPRKKAYNQKFAKYVPQLG